MPGSGLGQVVLLSVFELDDRAAATASAVGFAGVALGFGQRGVAQHGHDVMRAAFGIGHQSAQRLAEPVRSARQVRCALSASEGITDRMLGKATVNAERGLVDADLGAGLIKQRTARLGGDKSGGYRTIIAYRRGDRAVFLFGFAKSERANLDEHELSHLRRIGRSYLWLDGDGLEMAIAADEVMEVSYGQEEQG